MSPVSVPATTTRERPSPLARVLLGLLGLYQRTAAFRPPRCRFDPTCSQYAVDSVRVHGALRGMAHAAARVARCHPWHPGGFDPVVPPHPVSPPPPTESDS